MEKEAESDDHVGPEHDDDGDDDYDGDDGNDNDGDDDYDGDHDDDVYGEIGNFFVQCIRMIEYGILRTQLSIQLMSQDTN